jgi:hypothetical protein
LSLSDVADEYQNVMKDFPVQWGLNRDVLMYASITINYSSIVT